MVLAPVLWMVARLPKYTQFPGLLNLLRFVLLTLVPLTLVLLTLVLLTIVSGTLVHAYTCLLTHQTSPSYVCGIQLRDE